MRFDASQSMRMSQGMKLAPHMIQSMEILQMSMTELQERIEQELENNPTLEITEPEQALDAPAHDREVASTSGDDEGSGNDSDEFEASDFDDLNTSAEGDSTSEEIPLTLGDTSGQEDFERLEEFSTEQPDAVDRDGDESQYSDEFDRRSSADDEYVASSSSSDDDAPSKLGAMANTAGKGQGVQEQLLEQWRLSDIKPAYKQLGEFLIGFIEDDGYLRAPLEEVLTQAPPGLKGLSNKPLTLHDLTEALQALQLMLEPPGIAARNLRECLLLQIDAKLAAAEDGPSAESAEILQHRDAWLLARTLLDKHLEDLTNNRLPRIAAKLGTAVEALKPAVARLRTLRLAPGKSLAPTSNPGIVPDCIVRYDLDRDRYIAYLNDRRLPNLRVNEEYASLSKDRSADKKTREFLKTNLGNAQFLIDAIQQRKRTLLRVLEAVVEQQREFFDYGPQAIKPLPMTKVAEQLGIHVATVSRAVAEKYVQTPRGVYPLRKFFTSGTTTDTGEEVSWEAIKNAMTQLIESEDKRKPLSDDALAEALKAQGFDIARRTVAKYRDQLGIPTGRLRKVHGS